MNASNIVSSWAKCFRHGCFRRLAVALLIMLIAAPVGFGVDYYVAVDGKDTADGISLTTPLATLQKGIGKAVAGDTIHVRGGTYRQQVTVTTGGGTADAYLTIQAYGDEKPVFKGSDLVTGWEPHEGAIWKKTGWTVNSQQVFGNECHLQQIGPPNQSNFEGMIVPVGTGVSDMYPGTFHYDLAGKALYVWLPDGSDPNLTVMEASSRPALLSLNVPYVYLKGITARHCNPTMYDFNPSHYAAVCMGPDSIIEECDIQWGDFAGLLLASRSQAIRCIISNNGDLGVGAIRADNILVRECVINGNNYRNFNPMWHAGGLKLIPDASGTIEDNEISNNNGSGVWFDSCTNGNLIVIRSNRLRNNVNRSIEVEACNNSIIYNNLLIINREIGIYISGSNDTRCFNNTVVGTTDRVGIELGGVPRAGCTLKNNKVFNNIVFDSSCMFDLIIPQDNGGDTEGNTSDYNCFFRTTGSLKLNSNGQTYSSLETWRTATGFDIHSISEDPRFNLKTADDYSTSTMSPVVDAGMELPEVTTDIRGVPRPQGVASDMGAFETHWQDTAPPTVPLNVAAALIDWNRVRVSWSPASDNVGVVSYDVYRNDERRANTTETEFMDDGLATLTSYSYHVIAIDAAGLESATSEVIAIRSGAPDTTAPSQPQKPGLVAKSAFEICIAWGAATDNVEVTEYGIYRDGRKVGSTRATWFTDTGLRPGTSYDYRVSALDAEGNESKPSRSLNAKTTPKPVLSQIELWRLVYFGSATDSGEAAGAFDFDHDGSPNLLEYALGRNPTSGAGDDGPQGMPDAELDVPADRLVLVVNLPVPTPSDVVYEVLASSDLLHWTRIAQKSGTAAWLKIDSGGSIVPGPVVGGRQITKVHDSVSMTAQSRRMMTLRLAGVSVATVATPPGVAVGRRKAIPSQVAASVSPDRPPPRALTRPPTAATSPGSANHAGGTAR